LRASACLAAALLLAAPSPRAGAETGALPLPDGNAIMRRVDERPRGADQRLRMTWRLLQPSGAERVRELRSWWRDYRAPDGRLRSKRLIVFDAPADVKDTAFLVWSYRPADADDDRWIYLPALRKVRRVAGQDRGRSFAGTEFNYDDLGDREVDEDTHVLVRTEIEGERTLHVVESTPHDDDSPHARRLQWVDAETYTVPRIEYYDRHGRLEKVLEIEWQQIDGVWDWRRLEMANQRSGRRTVVEVEDAAHGLGLSDDAFSESALRFGGP
jgi:outer membrane lipoprotein-sorting protein